MDSRWCSWSAGLKTIGHQSLHLLATFYGIVLAASFFALLLQTAWSFRSGMRSGRGALGDLLASRDLRFAVTVAVLLTWFAAVVWFFLYLPDRLLLTVAAAVLLAVLLRALPAPDGRNDPSMLGLGPGFLVAGIQLLAMLIVSQQPKIEGIYWVHLFNFGEGDPLGIGPVLSRVFAVLPLPLVWGQFIYSGLISLELYAIIFLAFLLTKALPRRSALRDRQ